MEYNSLITIVVACIASLIAVHWVYFKVLKIAKMKNLVDNPNARKLQKTPVPVMGGVAVFFGMLVGIAAGVIYNSLMHTELIVPQYTIIAAMSVMLFVGSIDDMIGLSPKSRFVIEIITILGIVGGTGGCIDSLHGLWGIGAFSWWIAVPLTVVGCVGIINAINMIDGVNGLSSSLCILCNVLFGTAFAYSGQFYHAVINYAMAASLLPFFMHNMFGKSSKMFIGDAGTMVMGTLMSFDVIQILRSDTSAEWMAYANQGMCLVAMTLAVMSVPVADTLRVMTMRILHGRSPFSPDRTHLHHKLLEYSYSHFMTTSCEFIAAVLVVLAWAVSYNLKASIDVQMYVVLAAAAIVVWGSYWFLARNKTMHVGVAYRIRRYFANGKKDGEKKWWIRMQRWVDSGEEEMEEEID